MISIESISIKEFRGVRDLTLDLNGKNFAVCGANGTGKSGVVDALEFALTGNVSRLSGEGRGDVTVRLHGPHVDMRGEPEKARVKLTVRIPSLNRTATIERSVKAPADPIIAPNDAAVSAVFAEIAAHPEVVLSRRELIKYVLATPGERAAEVQALLHLGDVERVRATLQKIANDCERQLEPLRTAHDRAGRNLLQALEVPELTVGNVLAATNVHRAALGLPALAELNAESSLKVGMAAPLPAQPQRLVKAQALADIRAAREALVAMSSDVTRVLVADVVADLAALAHDPVVSTAVSWETFYTTGMELLKVGSCPFCDTPWDLSALQVHVRAKIVHLNDVAKKRDVVERKVAPLIATLDTARAAIDILIRHAQHVTPPVPMAAAVDYGVSCVRATAQVDSFLPLPQTITALTAVPNAPGAVLDEIAALERAVAALPEPSAQDSARDWLTIAQERLEVWRSARRALKSSQEQAQTARKVSDTYAAASDAVLVGTYAAVEGDFSVLYRSVHGDDEKKFSAKLTPTEGKLGLGVDFYGRGLFPPDAYHSEGHQDSMGLCLYLALMRYLHGAGFTLAVLDDVLMSVDSAHRREVCTLLKREFPDTQFILTTHDPIWLRHMKTEHLIGGRSSVEFLTWSVDQGPTQWDDRDAWTEIGDHLAKSKVREAAALLRHYLEYISSELCHRLRAPVEFRGDARYELGQLLPAAIRQMRKLYAQAKDAANSWNRKDLVECIAKSAAAFGKLADDSNAEQWQVNAAVHYNSWATLTREDFEPVVAAFRALVDGFTCQTCHEYLRATPDRETAEMLRCECGATVLNLLKKRD